MADLSGLSQKTLANPLLRSGAGAARLFLAMKRILSVLETEKVAAIRTLEMNISDAGPSNQRIEPHIIGVAGQELVTRNRVKVHRDPRSGKHNWFAPARLDQATVDKKLETLIPAYLATTAATFTTGLGDRLEIAVFKILQSMRAADRRFSFLGSFDLSARRQNGRFDKIEPPSP